MYLTPQFSVSAEMASSIPRILVESGLEVATMKPVSDSRISWERLTCRRDYNVAAVSIGHVHVAGFPERHVVAVSPDLRRILLFWRWRGDFRLVAHIAERLTALGAVLVEPE